MAEPGRFAKADLWSTTVFILHFSLVLTMFTGVYELHYGKSSRLTTRFFFVAGIGMLIS